MAPLPPAFQVIDGGRQMVFSSCIKLSLSSVCPSPSPIACMAASETNSTTCSSRSLGLAYCTSIHRNFFGMFPQILQPVRYR
eukprot:m.14689 g.14689  ORF g.14689 m.14689 type:complete len:82 (+) comp10329_c0_seq6:453-698(+)